MNIIELAKEATDGDAAVEGAFLCLTSEELHRFANLIIDECAKKCLDCGGCADEIREMKK